jgi:hypothetical protein
MYCKNFTGDCRDSAFGAIIAGTLFLRITLVHPEGITDLSHRHVPPFFFSVANSVVIQLPICCFLSYILLYNDI